MAENKVIIDVEVQGVQDAQKNLQKIEVSATEIGSSVKGVGESFKGVGAVVSAQGGVMGEAFNSLGESVGGLVDGFGAMSEVMTAGGKSGMLAFMGMLIEPPKPIPYVVVLSVSSSRLLDITPYFMSIRNPPID